MIERKRLITELPFNVCFAFILFCFVLSLKVKVNEPTEKDRDFPCINCLLCCYLILCIIELKISFFVFFFIA